MVGHFRLGLFFFFHISQTHLHAVVLSRGIRHNVTWNAQALALTSQGLPSHFPFLTCPDPSASVERKPVLTSARPSRKTTPSSRTASERKRLGEFYSTARLPPFNQPGPEKSWESGSHQKELEYTSLEILEAACNDSIPGLTGVSNFTVFLYCKLFEGENGSVDPAAAQMGLDLHATCSDAAWYLSAAEEDFFWVHVCSEFFAHEFNNTVCANASFWLQRASQVNKTVYLKKYKFSFL